MENKVSIGVIITVYNKEKYIDRALKSILLQKKFPDELIIIDDYSHDQSVSIVTDQLPILEKKISRCVFIKSTQNKGAAEARNIAIREATSDFLIFLDADDQYEIGYIEDIRQILTTNKNVSMITSRVRMESNGLEYPSNKIDKSLVKENGILFVKFPFQTLAIESIFVGGGNVCFKRPEISDDIFFDPLEKNFEEWDFYYRILKKTIKRKEMIVYLHKVNYIYNNIDENSLSRKWIFNYKELVIPKIIKRIHKKEELSYKGLLISIWFYNSMVRLVDLKNKYLFIKSNYSIINKSALNRYLIGGVMNFFISSNVLNAIATLYKKARFKE